MWTDLGAFPRPPTTIPHGRLPPLPELRRGPQSPPSGGCDCAGARTSRPPPSLFLRYPTARPPRYARRGAVLARSSGPVALPSPSSHRRTGLAAFVELGATGGNSTSMASGLRRTPSRRRRPRRRSGASKRRSAPTPTCCTTRSTTSSPQSPHAQERSTGRCGTRRPKTPCNAQHWCSVSATATRAGRNARARARDRARSVHDRPQPSGAHGRRQTGRDVRARLRPRPIVGRRRDDRRADPRPGTRHDARTNGSCGCDTKCARTTNEHRHRYQAPQRGPPALRPRCARLRIPRVDYPPGRALLDDRAPRVGHTALARDGAPSESDAAEGTKLVDEISAKFRIRFDQDPVRRNSSTEFRAAEMVARRGAWRGDLVWGLRHRRAEGLHTSRTAAGGAPLPVDFG